MSAQRPGRNEPVEQPLQYGPELGQGRGLFGPVLVPGTGSY